MTILNNILPTESNDYLSSNNDWFYEYEDFIEVDWENLDIEDDINITDTNY